MTTLAARTRRLVETIARNSQGMRATREAQRLSEMSDAELARLGIRREMIALHAFRGFLAS